MKLLISTQCLNQTLSQPLPFALSHPSLLQEMPLQEGAARCPAYALALQFQNKFNNSH